MTKVDGLRNPTVRLPDLTLPRASDGEPVRLRQGRLAPVIVLAHGAECAACREYAESLAERGEELSEWDGRPIILLPHPPKSEDGVAWAGGLGFPVLVDDSGRIAAAAGVEVPAVLVADQWGEVHESAAAGENHDFPAFERLVSTARYISLRCPECEGESY